MTTVVKAVRVCRGKHRLDGVTHTHPQFPGVAACGGQVFAEWFPPTWDGDEKLPGSWECYCATCQNCDCNGYDTLRECLAEAPEFWMVATVEGAT